MAGLLRGRFDVVLAADVINAEGLSELVFAIVRRYRACPGLYPKGMCVARSRRRARRIG